MLEDVRVTDKFDIPWQRMRIDYNKKYSTKYTTVREWIISLHEEHDYNSSRVADALIVSITSVFKLLKAFDIKKPSPKKKAFYDISEHRMQGMTILDIMRETKLSESYIYRLLKLTKRRLKKR